MAAARPGHRPGHAPHSTYPLTNLGQARVGPTAGRTATPAPRAYHINLDLLGDSIKTRPQAGLNRVKYKSAQVKLNQSTQMKS